MEEVERRERYVSTDVTGAVSDRGKRSLSVVAQMSFSFEKKRRDRLTTDVRRPRGGAGDIIFSSMWGSSVRRRERRMVQCTVTCFFGGCSFGREIIVCGREYFIEGGEYIVSGLEEG